MASQWQDVFKRNTFILSLECHNLHIQAQTAGLSPTDVNENRCLSSFDEVITGFTKEETSSRELFNHL